MLVYGEEMVGSLGLKKTSGWLAVQVRVVDTVLLPLVQPLTVTVQAVPERTFAVVEQLVVVLTGRRMSLTAQPAPNSCSSAM